MPDWLQYGGLGFAAMVVVGVGIGIYKIVNRMIDVLVKPLIDSLGSFAKNVGDMSVSLATLTAKVSDLSNDVYNGRCRYGTPSAQTFPAVKAKPGEIIR